MKVKSLQTNFSKGAVSPKLFGRIDLALYEQGVKRCENFIVMPQGGVTRRPGTRYVATVNRANGQGGQGGAVHLLSFVSSEKHAYVLVLGDGYLNLYQKGKAVLENGQILSLKTPYKQNELSHIVSAQSGNILYLVHPNHKPHKLVLTDTNGVVSWALSAVQFTAQPSQWKTGNYPHCVTLYEGRSVWSTPSHADTVWFSRQPTKDKAFTLEDMTLGVENADGMKYTLQGTTSNTIQWLISGRKLQIGTTGNTRTMTGSKGGALSPTSVLATQETANGCAPLVPVQPAGVTLYLGRSGRRIHAFAYDRDSDGFISPDISALADHLMVSGVRDWTYAQDPYSLVWMVCGDGTLTGMSYDPAMDMVAFHSHRLGGTSDKGAYGAVESITSIPNGAEDEVWFAVRRTINGKTVRTLERMISNDVNGTDGNYYVDCGLQITSKTAQKTFTGFSHLVGEHVDMLGDGAIRPMVQVKADGSLTLANNNDAKKLSVGLPYVSTIETLPHAVEMGNTMSYGDKIRSVTFAMRVRGMLLFSYGLGGVADEKMTVKDFRTTQTLMDSPPPIQSGFVDVTFNTGFKKDSSLKLVIDRPHGGELLGIGVDLITN